MSVDGVPVWAPVDDSPEAKADAARNNAAVAATLRRATGLGGLMQLGQGVGQIVTSGAIPPMASRGPAQALPTAEQRGALARGATNVLGGAGEAATALAPAAALERPLTTALGFGGALAGSYGAGKLADVVQASPDTKALLQQVGGWIGGIGGGAAGEAGGVALRRATNPEDALTDLLWQKGSIRDSSGRDISIGSQGEARTVAKEMLRQNPQGPIEGFQLARNLRAAAGRIPAPSEPSEAMVPSPLGAFSRGVPRGLPEGRPAPEPSPAGTETPAQGTLRAGPLGPVLSEPALYSRPISGPPAPTTQLALPGLNLPEAAQPFYSKAEQIAQAKLPKSGPGDSFLATLRNNGVKAEEIADLGLDSFAGKPKVTKQEFVDAIQSRRPQLEQTTLGEGQQDSTMYEDYATPGGENYRETLTQYPASEAGQRAQALQEEITQRKRALDEEIDIHNNASPEEQAQRWAPDYFDNERAAISNLYDELHKAQASARGVDYQSGHWQEHPNVLMHSRESDFTTTDGMPVRHVHEWQSDLHQKGREQGYQSPTVRTLPEGFHTARNPQGYYYVVNREGVPTGVPSAPSQEAAIDNFIGRYNANANPSGAPNAPFKKSWHELAVKDSIRRAINDGMQGMTWDTGQTQADRYNLAKQVEHLEYDPHTETLSGFDHGGRRIVDENVKPEELGNYVGKEGAEKLQRQIENYVAPSDESDYEIRHDPETETYTVHDASGEMVGEEESYRDAERTVRDLVEGDREHSELPSLYGDDLQVGGHGMKGFYDKIIPDYVSKYAKKWGAKVDTAEIPTTEGGQFPYQVVDAAGEPYDAFRTREYAEAAAKDIGGRIREPETTTVHRLTFTPQMIDAIKSEGQPLYRRPMEAAGGEPELEAARRGAAGEVQRDPVEIAQNKVNSLRAQLDNAQTAGEHSHLVSQLRNAEDELEAARGGTQTLAARGQGVQANRVAEYVAGLSKRQREVLAGNAAGMMQSEIDPGGANKAAQLRIDDATRLFLESIGLTKGMGEWLGVNVHSSEAANWGMRLDQLASDLRDAGAPRDIHRGVRDLATNIQRIMQLNSEPGAGHAGLPIEWKGNEATALHERRHGGQRAFSPSGGIADFTDLQKDSAHPSFQAIRPEALDRIAGPNLANRVAEAHTYILDGAREFLGLSKQQAVDYMEHALNVLEQKHGAERIANPPRLSTEYLQGIRDFIKANREPPNEEVGTGQTAHAGGTGGGESENAGAIEGASGTAAPGSHPEDVGRGGGETERQQVEPEQGSLFRRPTKAETAAAEAKLISPRNPTAVDRNRLFDPLAEHRPIDTQSIFDLPVGKNSGRPGADVMADLLRQYPGNAKIQRMKTREAIEAFRRQAKDNLLFWHDNTRPEIRDQSALWYDGANHVVRVDLPREYGTSIEQNMGGIAGISPKYEWNLNVSAQKRLIEAMLQQNELRYTPKMEQRAREWLESAAKGDIARKAKGKPLKLPGLRAALKDINGKRLSDLSRPDQKAMWIQLHDEAHGDPTYDLYMPDGTVVGKARKADGSLAKFQWTIRENVAKAISMFEDDSRENIHKQLGEAHKIRSFYNNGTAPNSPRGDVTVDTHQVAGDQVRPLSANSDEVNHNFGNKGAPGSKATGTYGTYGIHADAVRDAAKERDYKRPRQMQSITWDGTRTVFPSEYKTETNQDTIDNIWRLHDRKKLTLAQAQRAAVEAAGGFDSDGYLRPPDWAQHQGRGRSRSYGGNPQAARNPGNPRQLSGGVVRGDVQRPIGRGAGVDVAGGTARGQRRELLAPSPVPAFIRKIPRR